MCHHAGEYVHGAFTNAFVQTWDRYPVQSYADVLTHVRQQLLGRFDQITQLSITPNIDINSAMEV